MEGNRPEPGWLAIKDWETQQVDGKGRVIAHGTPVRWIRDYTGREDDREYARLSMFQRAVLDGCRRLRGRMGRNLPNDATHIARAMNSLPTERARIADTIATLIERGFLIPCFQDLDFLQAGKKRAEQKKEGEEPSSSSPSTKGKEPQGCGGEAGEQHRERPASASWTEDVEDASGVIPAAAIRRAVSYFSDPRCPDPWYRERGMTEALVRRNARRMVEGVPPGWDPEHPSRKPAPPRPLPDPGCPGCQGTGRRIQRVDGSFYREECDCVTGAEQREAQ